MQQIMNYLATIYDISSVLLIPSSGEFMGLIPYLVEVKGVEKIYCVCCRGDNSGREGASVPEAGQKWKQECKPGGVEYYTPGTVPEPGLRADMLLFDKNSRAVVQLLQRAAPRYLVGRLAFEEEYFGLWEQFRQTASFIYMEREKMISPEENVNDADKCEILDWKGNQADIELSVILPVYNVAEYLPHCMETLTAWKAPYVEFLFVNDGSTDDSEEVVRSYMKKDPRIRLLVKENGGCASARNRGIEEARGRYLGFVDPDDFIDESMFYKLLKRIMLGNFELAYCGYYEFYEASGASEKVLNDCLKEPYLSGTYRRDKVCTLAVNTRVAIWRCLYRKDVLNAAGIRFHEDLKRFDDLPFRVEYLFAAGSAVCVPEHLYYYRLGRKGQDVSCRSEGFFVHFTIFKHLDEYVDRLKDSRLTDLLQVVKLQTHGFALSRIDDRSLKRNYMRRAGWQLDRNMGYLRTVCLMMMYTGKGNLGWYTRCRLTCRQRNRQTVENSD